MTPQDVSDLKAADKVREELKKEGKEAICYGMGDGLEAVERASEVGKNIVVSAAALEVAKYLEKTFGTPYEIGYPAAGELVPNLDYQGKKILVVQMCIRDSRGSDPRKAGASGKRRVCTSGRNGTSSLPDGICDVL